MFAGGRVHGLFRDHILRVFTQWWKRFAVYQANELIHRRFLEIIIAMRDYKSFKVILYVRQWKRTLMKLSCEILNFPGMFKWVNRKCVPYAISI